VQHARFRGAAAAALLAVAVIGCSGSEQQPVASPNSSSGHSPATSAEVASPGSSGSTEPQSTPWAGEAVLGLNQLGAGDNEIGKAVADFSEATAAEDLVRMRGATIGLQNLATALTANVDRIATYPPMAGLVAKYRAAFGPMQDGTKALVAALDAGDSPGIVAAIEEVTRGMVAYGQVRQELAAWVEQAPEQQRMLVK
jgi:hypothetical protein